MGTRTLLDGVRSIFDVDWVGLGFVFKLAKHFRVGLDVGLVFTPFLVIETSLSSNAGKMPVCPFMLFMGDLDLLMVSEVPLEATSTLPGADLSVSVDLGVLGLPLGVFILILGVLGWFRMACRLAYSAKNSSSCRSRYNCWGPSRLPGRQMRDHAMMERAVKPRYFIM